MNLTADKPDKLILTDKSIRGLTLDRPDQCFWDSVMHGFGIRVRASGARTWIVQYDIHGRSRRISLGSPAVVPAADARAKAKELLAQRALGGDPAGDKARDRTEAAKTLGALLPRYLKWKQPSIRPSTFLQTARHLNVHLAPLHREPITRVTRAMIAQRLAELSASNGSGAATRARASWSAFFMWACREGLTESNCVTFTNPPCMAQKRKHAVSHSEIGLIWAALDGAKIAADYAAIIRLLILTGARRDEIASLQRHEINLDTALLSLPPERMKNKEPHLIPLSRPALAILRAQMERQSPDRAFVFGYKAGRPFSGFSAVKERLNAKLGATVAPWIVHDLRRTVSTSLHQKPFSVPSNVVEVILAHVSGHKSGVAGVYNVAEYLDERRDALDRWAEFVMQIVGGNVVTMAAA